MINPIDIFGNRLTCIDKPARYLGGESGAVRKPEADFRVMLCFPDLYEIGMSNNAMRILYAELNACSALACERVFVPASDFEAELRSRCVLLYGLETGTAVKDSDMLAFTIGYELAATNLLLVLDLSGIPFLCHERSHDCPLVIAGGPAITNPAPYGSILDAVWIGEAEVAFAAVVETLAIMKKQGATRQDLLDRLSSEPAVWIPGKQTKRHVFAGFSEHEYGHLFPVPVVKPVQDHGVVEIMRGCPNGCRFCHAGYFYRPQRLRAAALIARDVETQVRLAGHRQITLSSLSSGDYPDLIALVRSLNAQWRSSGVSFQLPSLKIEGFPIGLIEELSGTRKGGLTFAVETPLEQWQTIINKQVSIAKIKSILQEAVLHGYRLAKIYFMIGLPLPTGTISEASAMIAFLEDLDKSTDMRINVTISPFVPKPHTPFQWACQLRPDDALSAIYTIKDALKKSKKIKISYHSPYLSMIEGIIARGDERVGEILLDAYRHGARFDAWDDHFSKEIWATALKGNQQLLDGILDGYELDAILPWHEVSLGISEGYLRNEAERSQQAMLTSGCIENCTLPCGACTHSVRVTSNTTNPVVVPAVQKTMVDIRQEASLANVQRKRVRLLFKFRKRDVARYYAHHGIWEMLAGSYSKAGFDVLCSEGFNPAPRLEISEPLPLGFASCSEYGTILLGHLEGIESKTILQRLNAFLPDGLAIEAIAPYTVPVGRFQSLSSVHWGSLFRLDFATGDYTTFKLKDDLESAMNAHDLLKQSVITVSHAGSMDLLLPFTGKRELGLIGLFQTYCKLNLRDIAVLVTRVAQYAKSADDGLPISYEQFYSVSWF
jgi:radical SAM superfamily enzyme YgiQ (UPF0313 family)